MRLKDSEKSECKKKKLRERKENRMKRMREKD